MRAHVIEGASPVLDQDWRFFKQVKGFPGQQFIPYFTIEEFAIAIFPGTTGFNEQGVDAQPSQPTADRAHAIYFVICYSISYTPI
jgi:hypothetical protein